MTISRVQVKIVGVDPISQTVNVAWASDQSQNPIDQYPVYGFPLCNFSETASAFDIIQQLALQGVQECERQCRAENTQTTTSSLVTQLLQQVGVINEFDLGALTITQLPPPLATGYIGSIG